MLAVFWVMCMIAARIYLEDVLCIGKIGFSLPIEVAHMALWWSAVVVSIVWIVSRVLQVQIRQACTWFAWVSPGMLAPPIIDFLTYGRSYEYPYPSGDVWDYIEWTVGFMPHSISLGQRIEIICFFALVASFVAQRVRGRRGVLVGVGTVLALYLVLTWYAWYPAFFRAFVPAATSHPEWFAASFLSVVIVAQIFIMRRMGCPTWRLT